MEAKEKKQENTFFYVRGNWKISFTQFDESAEYVSMETRPCSSTKRPCSFPAPFVNV